MAARKTLKVYRTPIGFHDAYVAAPTQKAALAALGTDKNLFARGMVEIVDDPALTRAPLATPGQVVKKLRGTAAEQFAALPPASRTAAPAAASGKPPGPKPARDPVDAAERAVSDAAARHRDAAQALADEAEAIARRRRALDAEYERERARLAKAQAAAEAAYGKAMAKWRG